MWDSEGKLNMLRWTKDIFRWIKPRHLIESIKNPQRALRELKYRYTFTSKCRFIEDTLLISKDSAAAVFKELFDSNFSKMISRQFNQHHLSTGRGAMGDEAELLYACVRLIRPEVIIETGVGAGYSTAHLLEAIRINDRGILYSIDYYKENEQCGWVIPDYLKKRWKLVKGLSRMVLNPLLEELKFIDVFIHDSDHSYENMIMEFRAIWPFLKAGGIFLAHDIGRNDAFFDFLKEINQPFWRVRTYPVLAGFKKTATAYEL